MPTYSIPGNASSPNSLASAHFPLSKYVSWSSRQDLMNTESREWNTPAILLANVVRSFKEPEISIAFMICLYEKAHFFLFRILRSGFVETLFLRYPYSLSNPLSCDASKPTFLQSWEWLYKAVSGSSTSTILSRSIGLGLPHLEQAMACLDRSEATS